MAVLVTATFYKSPTDVRHLLALRFLEEAQTAGYPVVIVDGSPADCEWVRDSFRRDGVTVLQEEKQGMGASRRQAMRAALERYPDEEAFVWIEPEKAPLVPLLAKAIEEVEGLNSIDLVLPRRRSLRGYPEYQEFCEHRGNWEAGNMTGRYDLDLWFGPRIMRRWVAKQLFLTYKGDYGDKWDSIFIFVLRALIDRTCVVASFIVDYVHPPEQTQAETGDEVMNRKRDEQLGTILAGIEMECRKLGLLR
jgi:hypothetical protein